MTIDPAVSIVDAGPRLALSADVPAGSVIRYSREAHLSVATSHFEVIQPSKVSDLAWINVERPPPALRLIGQDAYHAVWTAPEGRTVLYSPQAGEVRQPFTVGRSPGMHSRSTLQRWGIPRAPRFVRFLGGKVWLAEAVVAGLIGASVSILIGCRLAITGEREHWIPSIIALSSAVGVASFLYPVLKLANPNIIKGLVFASAATGSLGFFGSMAVERSLTPS